MRSSNMRSSNESHWDVVIVGASFAGAACALAAAQRGLRVCLIERKRDPGIKLHTTGIIVREAAERTWLSRLPAHLVHRVSNVHLHAPNLRALHLSSPEYYFLTTDTPNVLRWLADEVQANGVTLRLATPFQDATREDGGWRIDGVGHTRYLVGADGAKSRVAERTGLGRVQDFLYAMEYEFTGMQLPGPRALHCFISKRFAPGYIGWVVQGPTGVQAGLALRHRTARAQAPDITGFLQHVVKVVGIPGAIKPDAIRAGLIPCGGPVSPLSGHAVVLTGDAAGIVSPVTAGGIHSAWMHGWTLGKAMAAHVHDGGPRPEQIAEDAAPRFRTKRLLRWAFDHLQMDWPFDLLLYSPPLRWAAETVYFHRRGYRP